MIIAGLSMIFAPLNVAAFLHIPKELRGAAVGLLALLRNEGGSVGTSVGKIILDRREQFHTLRLNESLDPLNPALDAVLQAGPRIFHAAERRPCRGPANDARHARSAARSASAVAGLLRRILRVGSRGGGAGVSCLLMRRSVAEKGAHISAE